MSSRNKIEQQRRDTLDYHSRISKAVKTAVQGPEIRITKEWADKFKTHIADQEKKWDNDVINHPAHYAASAVEVIEAIEAWKLDFHRGNVVKYVARAGKKNPAKELEDLEKAAWYLRRAIELVRAKDEQRKPCRPNRMRKK